MKISSLLVVVGLSAVACASAPERPDVPPLPALPAAWISAATGALAGDGAAGPWWTTLGEPELDLLIEEALEHNHDLAALAERVRAAAGDVRIARAAGRPTLDFELGAARRRQVFVGFPLPGGGVLDSTSTSYDAGFSAAWELDLWGRIGAGVRAAEAETLAAQADLAAARLSLVGTTAQAWFALRNARLQRELAERTLESWRGSEGWIQERFDAGIGPALDVSLARANVAGAEARLASSHRAEGAAARALELLLGRYPQGELGSAGPFAPLPPPVPAGLPVELLARRPDLFAAGLRVDAALARAAAARADLWPRLVLTANGGSASDSLGDLLDGDFSVWGLAARIAQPLVDGGRRRAGIESLDAEGVARGRTFAGALLAACAEVEGALDAERHLGAQVASLERARAASVEGRRLAEDQYRAGVVGIVTSLDSQRRALAAEGALLDARAALVQNRIGLHVALGGGFVTLAPERN